MFETADDEAEIQVARGNRHIMDEKQREILRDREIVLHNKKVDNTLNLIKHLGDIVTASQGIGLPKYLTGKPLNDGQMGLGGLISALIACYQLFPKSSKESSPKVIVVK